MYDRAVFTVSADRIKAWAKKITHFRTKLIQLIGCTDLCDLLLVNILFDPFHKANMRNTVLDLRFADILNLCFILQSFKQNLWILYINDRYLLWNIFIQCIVQSYLIKKQCGICIELLNILIYIIIRM